MTIPILLAIIMMHVVLALPSKAFPERFPRSDECRAGGTEFKDFVQCGDLDTATEQTVAAVQGGATDDDADEDSTGIVGWARGAISSVSGFVTTLFGAVRAIFSAATTFFTFNYAILDAGDDMPGVSVWEMVSQVIRWGLSAVQIVVGLRIILSLRGAG